MMQKTYLFAAAVVALTAVGVMALVSTSQGQGTTIKSGPQAGEKLAGPFHPLNCNGKSEGKKNCLYCENGLNPVAMVFARDNTPEVAKLIKAIDAATVKHADWDMGSFVVFLSDKEALPQQLTDLAKTEKLQKCVLSVDNPAGPEGYNVAKEAAVTVVLYRNRTAVVNHTYRSAGDLSEKAIQEIINDVSKIQPK
jgi:hypothetical protein